MPKQRESNLQENSVEPRERFEEVDCIIDLPAQHPLKVA
jgi:hypothetical protein